MEGLTPQSRSPAWDGPSSSFADDLAVCGCDLPLLLQLIVERVASIVGGAAVLAVVSADGEHLEPGVIHHSDPDVMAFMEQFLGSHPTRIGEGIAGKVAAQRRAAVLGNISSNTIAELVHPDHRAFAARHPIHSLLIVPMVTAGDLIGTLGVARIDTTVPYGTGDLRAAGLVP